VAIIHNEVPSLAPWFVKRAAELCSAVGRVSVAGQGFGTGFLIAPGIILTCQHVLRDKPVQESSFELDYQRDEDGSFRRVTTVKLNPEMCFVANEKLDFAVVGLESELKDRPVMPLVDDGNTRVGEELSLFHYPQAGPLQLSLRRGTVLAVYNDIFHHDANTQPGSAGGPLLDQNLRLVGLHHASIPRNDERMHTSGESASGTWIANEAIRASAILAEVAKYQPKLFAQPNVAGPSETVRPVRPVTVRSEPKSVSPAAAEIVEASASPLRNSVFISYAHDDQGKRKWRERLRIFLSPFGAELDVWDDSRIATGAQWRTEIDIALKRARVAVLLIGPSFLGSKFINGDELPPLLKAAAAEGVIILPLITNHCSYEKTALGKFQAFNDPKKPLEALELSEQNRTLQQFAERIDEDFHRTENLPRSVEQ
jgi:V8-like Glu-specific endopeptidase